MKGAGKRSMTLLRSAPLRSAPLRSAPLSLAILNRSR